MNTPHTPGPWEIDPDVSTDVIRMDGSRDRVGVADCMSFNGPEIEECEANARLIAAAPELLQAVIDLLAVAPSKAPAAGLLVGIEEKHAEAIRNAKQAIAKATEQTP